MFPKIAPQRGPCSPKSLLKGGQVPQNRSSKGTMFPKIAPRIGPELHRKNLLCAENFFFEFLTSRGVPNHCFFFLVSPKSQSLQILGDFAVSGL